MNQIETAQSSKLYYPPGGILIWIIIFLELLTFGAVLLAMAFYAREEPNLFHQSRLKLNVLFGTTNTVFLLFSGYCMAMAVAKLKNNDLLKTKKYMWAAIVGGLLFLGLKSVEYYEKIETGLTMGLNSFWNFYWMLTVFHVVHVLVGLVILSVLLKGIYKNQSETLVEDVVAGASFWHMCDLIWLLLFPILYLIF